MDILTTRVGVQELGRELAACRWELAACRSELAASRSELAASRSELAITTHDLHALSGRLEWERGRMLDTLRVIRDDDSAAWDALWRLRETEDYAAAFDEGEPLVSVIIPTWNNWRAMRDRALPSLLAQTYERYECIVVGDAAPPEAEEVVRSFRDERLRFVNLPYRGPYPEHEVDAWRVAGTTPANTGLALSRGRWILYGTDDDNLRPTCIAALLALARERRAEVPYGKQVVHEPDGKTEVIGVFPPEHSQWGTQASLIHAGLRFIIGEPSDWLFEIPNDWSMAERMLRIGVRFAMLEEPVADYYPTRLWAASS
jgi:hypothetical protein